VAYTCGGRIAVVQRGGKSPPRAHDHVVDASE
jgi:hypothetical protein